MAWVKVPAEHHPLFRAALPADPRIETLPMFGGLAAKVNGHFFAGLFGRSTVLLLQEPDRAVALALEGASLFDPMGDRRVRSDKVMLPERLMRRTAELRSWISRAFEAALRLPEKEKKPRPASKRAPATKKVPAKHARTTKKAPAKRAAPKKPGR